MQLLVAIALASGAYAANSCSGNLDVSSQSDLDGIGGCQTYNGDINIKSVDLTTANLNVQTVSGSINIVNATKLTAFTAPNLKEISDDFNIQTVTQLSTLSAPQLTKVGTLQWVAVPALSSVKFDTGITSASEIVISNTGLTSLEGINVYNPSVFNINNNDYLKQIDVALQSVSNSLDISYNAASVEASFDQLKWANNITFRDVGSVSLANLTNVNNSLGFVNNTFNGISVPQLKNLGGSLAIVSNANLSNISFPQLSAIGGGFQIANNTKLSSILGFPKVKTVGGAIDFIGAFNAAQLSSLDLVKGGVDIETNSSSFNCSSWDQKHSDGDIHGDNYVCKGASTSVSVRLTGSMTTGGGDSSGSGSTASSSKHKNGGAVMIPMEYSSVLGVVAAFVFQFV